MENHKLKPLLRPIQCHSAVLRLGVNQSRGDVSEAYLVIQVVRMLRDVNPNGAIFGGVILSYIDQAGAVGTRREVMLAGGRPPVLATLAVNRVEFKRPVLVGDVVSFLTRLVRIGRTSITMQVSVEAERGTKYCT